MDTVDASQRIEQETLDRRVQAARMMKLGTVSNEYA